MSSKPPSITPPPSSPQAPPQPVRPFRPTPEQVKDCPIKYTGYRVFSKWVASDQGFLIARKFGALNARVILSLQDEISELEDELDATDEVCSRTTAPNEINNGSFRLDPIPRRLELVRELLPEKLVQYSGPAVHDEDIGYVKQYFDNAAPIDDIEAAYIDFGEDLIPIKPKQRSFLRKYIEPSLLQKGVRRFFQRKPRDYDMINDGLTIWQDDSRVEGLCTAALAVMGLAMLIGPLWILEFVGGTHTKLGIMTGFIALFFAVVHVATTARVFEVLAATAAYSAVLMVFLQLGTLSR
ncbi:hypothetical protein FGG08_000464 [Glutinoglossum americanum]|uniref:DUF6594 domain-containing protein n=1 Tax=Glutinoglossum americanum TaxID=1670608 RepID=A0A9P8IDB8_9PEZI|nr:hypothetical protein FGG08_000464 [Glutinoglossum americanum]